MKWKAYAPLAVAIVLGLLAARVATSMVSPSEIRQVVAANLTPIVVAAHDMEPGTLIGEADVATAKVETNTMPTGAFTMPAQAVTKVLKAGVVKGQPILPNTLADDGSGYGVGATLPKGMRAITVDINDTTGVAGFIQPQCRVDVVTTLQLDGKQTAKTLLESVQVLAVGSRTNPNAAVDPQAQQSHTVTLLVKPKDAEKLELAVSTSRVRLLLRNGRDGTQSESEGVTLAELKGGKDGDPFGPAAATNASDTAPATTQPAAAAPTVGWTVQVIKGGAVSRQFFELPAAPAPTAAPSAAKDADQSVDTDPSAMTAIDPNEGVK